MTEKKIKLYEAQKNEIVVGVDEVGRGALAGDLFVCAIILNRSKDLLSLGINDSKKLTFLQREDIYKKIQSSESIFIIQKMSAQEVDKIGILNATMKAMSLAVAEIMDKYVSNYLQNFESSKIRFVCLIDGNKVPSIDSEFEYFAIPVINGDGTYLDIGAASICAKVLRDQYMKDQSIKFPNYQWHSNYGYGTKNHISSINKYGTTPLHRMSFLKNILSNQKKLI